MKKTISLYILSILIYLLLVVLFQGWLRLEYLTLWFGGILGVLLPDVDRLVYVFILNSEEQYSKEMILYAKTKNIKALFASVITNRGRSGYLFHSALFQIVFLVFTIFLIGSTPNPFVWGLVLGFLMHLLINQLTDFQELKNVDDWFKDFPLDLDLNQKKYYLAFNVLVLILLGVMM